MAALRTEQPAQLAAICLHGSRGLAYIPGQMAVPAQVRALATLIGRAAMMPSTPAMEPESPWRNRRALLALLPLAIFCFAVIVWSPWHSNLGPDTVTEFEQIRNVADHGTLAWDNGPVQGFAELRTRWFIHAHGKAYGIVPPLMAYLVAPAFKLDGFRGVVRFLWLMLLSGSLLTYALTYRLTRHPAIAVASAYALMFGTSLSYWGTSTGPFVPAAWLGITAIYLGSRAYDQPTRWRAIACAAGAGVCSGVGLGCHLAWVIALALVGTVFLLEGKWYERLERTVAYGAGVLPPLIAIGIINHDRFGSWSPLSYGPCNSSTCTPTSVTNTQSASAFVETVQPVFWYVVAFAVCLWLVRGSPRWTAMVAIVGACAAFLPDTAIQHKFWILGRAAWGFLVDLGNIDIGFRRATDGPGSWSTRDGGSEPMCVRALLECSPILALALLTTLPSRAKPTGVRDRATILMLAAAAIGVVGVLTMRANLVGPDIYGYPILNPRYNTLLMFPAMVLAFVAVSPLRFRAWHAALAVIVGVYGGMWLAAVPGDEDLFRRQMTHWFPLALGLATWVLVAAARIDERRVVIGQLACIAVALTAGYGFASFFGIDVTTGLRWRGIQDAHTRELAQCTPQRFILLGGYAADEAMALHDQRDILWINVGMGPRDGSNARYLLEQYMRPDRPAFILQDNDSGPWHFNWPGWRFEPCATSPRVLRVVRTAEAAAEE